MAHDPRLGFAADCFSAAATDATAVMPPMEEGALELFGLHADMELLGMRGMAMPPAPHSGQSSKAAVLIDAGGGADGGGSTNATVRFLSDGQHHQQAPLSLSPCRPPDVGAGMTLHQHLGSSSRQQQQQQPAAWMHDYAGAGSAWHLSSSRFLLPMQQLLQEFCSLPVDSTNKQRTKAAAKASQEETDGGGEGSSASWAPSRQIQTMDAVELQRLKDKLYVMLEEVDRRYRRYCDQMRSLAGGFEAVAGERAAAAYTALASRTISRHFRNLRDGVVAQLQAVRKALGEKDVAVPGMTRGDTPRLRVLDQCILQHKALNQAGMMESHPWRPQRGLPERAVTILRAWLFEHFLHPYPSDVDKHILARQTGLSRSQVSNWFINARVRLWKPMVEEMYVVEMKGEQPLEDGGSGGGGPHPSLNPNPSSSSQASAAEAYNGCHQHGVGEAEGAHNVSGVERKPTREQLLHDAGSLAAVVNVGGSGGARLENFGGLMDHLEFDAYDGHHHHHQAAAGFGGGVSLTLGLQQHADSRDSGVNIAFGAPPPSAHHGGGYLQFAAGHQQQMEGGGGHHVQFGGGAMDGEAPHGQEQYRSQLSAGFHLLRDLAG